MKTDGLMLIRSQDFGFWLVDVEKRKLKTFAFRLAPYLFMVVCLGLWTFGLVVYYYSN